MPGSFRDESARYLRDVYIPRLATALETLPADDLWWRPHAGCISFGTILLHLEGNVRQWILGGLGGAADHRDRDSEFEASAGPDGKTLLAKLTDTVVEAAKVIESLDPQGLQRRIVIQGHDVTGEEGIYHVVEHFSWHTGQAVWIAKARAGAEHGLGFYDDAALHRAAGNADAPDTP
jgi:uncharacterized damage-inducible protein DinB